MGRGMGRLAALALALSVLGGCAGFVGPGYYNGMGDGGDDDGGGWGGMGYGAPAMPFFGGMGYGGMGGFGEGGGWGGGDDD